MRFKRVKNTLPSFLICLTILFFPIHASADVLFGKAYYQTLHKYLTQSKSSITIAMYFIIIDPGDQANPVNELVNDLIAAKIRGYTARSSALGVTAL